MTTETDLAQALRDLVRINEQHNSAVESVIGRPLDWNDDYLNKARAALAAHDRQREAGEAEPVAAEFWRQAYMQIGNESGCGARLPSTEALHRRARELSASHPPGTHSSRARTASGVQTAVTSEAVRELVTKWRDRSDELPRDDLVSLTHRLKLRDCADELAAALGPQPVRLSESPCCGGRIITHGEVCGYCGKRAGPQPVGPT